MPEGSMREGKNLLKLAEFASNLCDMPQHRGAVSQNETTGSKEKDLKVS
jgi:hypothetical protein